MVNENEITEVKIDLETLEMQKYFEYADPNESDDEITRYLLVFFLKMKMNILKINY